MKRLIKITRKMVITIIIIVVSIAVIGGLFIKMSPQFGGEINKEQEMIYLKSENYKSGKFINKTEVNLDMSLKDIGKSLAGYIRPIANTIPNKNLQVDRIDSLNIVKHKGSTRMIWFGHSTFLVQMDNTNILIDPMFGTVPAPHPWLGNNRFSKDLPIEVGKLPKIDAVLISHDHYDHLDYGSISKLKNKVEMFYTPLGVGAHLKEWGIEKERIVELDWWQEATFKNLSFICTPAQHFSGRGLTDRARTLWSSWVIQSQTENIFFSGDSGYGSHFKEIGEKYGPFDFAMMECGQYNEMWSDIHMFPEETVQAGLDVKAKQIMPIHWGAFKLAMHSWTDPVERIIKEAEELNVDLLIPRIGEEIFINKEVKQDSKWWKEEQLTQ